MICRILLYISNCYKTTMKEKNGEKLYCCLNKNLQGILLPAAFDFNFFRWSIFCIIAPERVKALELKVHPTWRSLKISSIILMQGCWSLRIWIFNTDVLSACTNKINISVLNNNLRTSITKKMISLVMLS